MDEIPTLIQTSESSSQPAVIPAFVLPKNSMARLWD
jgi:hypothetical protein